MAGLATIVHRPNAQSGDESDYGSDFSPEEEEIVNRLLCVSPGLVRDTEDSRGVAGLQHNGSFQIVRAGRAITQQTIQEKTIKSESASIETINPGYSSLNEMTRSPTQNTNTYVQPNDSTGEVQDNRSPIERFRTAPRKPLSVTDLVSPAWCELQYWYTLKFHGRKRRTQAMKQGSEIHKQLEDQIHVTAKVDIETKEDSFGLRIWNVIQGLHTLKEVGYTRELEIWGVIDGLVVNGVIDEVSFTCPDTDLEAALLNKTLQRDGVSADQLTITEFLERSGSTSVSSGMRSKRQSKKIYISDVKTRSTRSLPKGAAFFPTKMQLMLYHHLISNLASDQVDFSVLLSRYGLDGDKPFSESFITQVGNLDDISDKYTTESPPTSNDPSNQGLKTMIMSNNSLWRLWSFMINTYQNIVPNGKDSIGDVLTAEYRSRQQGEILGSSTLAMDGEVLNLYLENQLKWWRGEREPLGVVIEEAYKCNSCDFAETCGWRQAKADDAREKARKSKKVADEAMKRKL